MPKEEERFRRMIESHGRAFAFSPGEIGCVNPKIVEPMVIFTVPHVPWNIKPIPVPRAHIPKLIELLKEKIEMGILDRQVPHTRIGGSLCRRRMAPCASSKICKL